MLGALLRLAVFRMLPRRILPALVLYDVYRMFRRRAPDQRRARLAAEETRPGPGSTRPG